MAKKARKHRVDGDKLRARREALGLTQEELAHETVLRKHKGEKRSVSVRTIRRRESGGYARLSTVSILADALGLELEALLIKTKHKPKYDRQPKVKFRTIERQLRKKFQAQAKSSLTKQLRQSVLSDYQGDYQPLEMEAGLVPTEKEQVQPSSRSDARPLRPENHNRFWQAFDPKDLMNPQAVYILSSDTGTGKTTFLRNLQLEILKEKQFLPIFLHASELEGLDFNDSDRTDATDRFVSRLADVVRIKAPKEQVTRFLKNLFKNKSIVLLVDGLDQIQGTSTDYRKLLDDLVFVFRENLIIAARPFAVISQEQESNVKFLRLKPFSAKAQEQYFGKHYDRACEICDSCRELMGIPMLAYMVRMLIERKHDRNVKNRSDIYKRFVDYVLKPETGYKHDKLQSNVDIETDVRQALGEISYEALARKKPYKQKIPPHFYRKYVKNQGTTTVQLLKHGLVKLIIDRSQGIDEFLYFSHQSFQEYMAAEWAHKNEELTKRILDEMWNPNWKEVIKFLAGFSEEDKEDFISKIYSPRYKDNCIHSRLFLAAECCGELCKVSKSEELILTKLKTLMWTALFLEESILAISKLNGVRAINLLVYTITGKLRYETGAQTDEIIYFIWKILPKIKHKLTSEHIDDLIYLITQADQRSLVRAKCPILTYVLTDRLTTPQISRVIDASCRGELDNDFFVGVLLFLSKSSSVSHINQLCDFLTSKDEAVVLRALGILLELSKAPTVDYENFFPVTVSSKDIPTPRYDLIDDLSRKSVGILFSCLEKDTYCIKEKAYHTLVNLVITGNLRSQHMNRLIMMVEDFSSYKGLIVKRIAHLYDALPTADVQQILGLLKDHNPWVQSVGLDVIYHIAHKLSKKDVSKIVIFLDSDDDAIRVLAAEILEKTNCKLSRDQVNKVIDLLRIKENTGSWSRRNLVRSAIRTLSTHTNSMSSTHVDCVIEHLGAIEFDIEYFPFVDVRTDMFNELAMYCPLPAKLAQRQIDRIACFLDSPIPFKKKLGVQLLINVGKTLLRKYIRKIVRLLPDSEPDVLIRILEELRRIHDRLSRTELERVISCLKSRSPKVKYAAADCLIEAKNSLVDAHILKLLDLLEEKDVEIIGTALKVLAQFPERVHKKSLRKLIGIIERGHSFFNVERVVRLISRFGPRLDSTEIDEIITLAETGKPKAQEAAIATLCELQRYLSANEVHRIVRCIHRKERSVKFGIAQFLRKYSHLLGTRDANSIVRNYIDQPSDLGLVDVVSLIPPQVMTRHINQIVRLLDRKNSSIKANVLFVLKPFCEMLSVSGFVKVEKLLTHTDEDVRYCAYDILKKAYSMGALAV